MNRLFTNAGLQDQDMCTQHVPFMLTHKPGAEGSEPSILSISEDLKLRPAPVISMYKTRLAIKRMHTLQDTFEQALHSPIRARTMTQYVGLTPFTESHYIETWLPRVEDTVKVVMVKLRYLHEAGVRPSELVMAALKYRDYVPETIVTATALRCMMTETRYTPRVLPVSSATLAYTGSEKLEHHTERVCPAYHTRKNMRMLVLGYGSDKVIPIEQLSVYDPVHRSDSRHLRLPLNVA